MNDKKENKLILDKEAVIQLSEDEMEQVEGGTLPPTWTAPFTNCLCES